MSQELFATICFLALMDGHGGMITKDAAYIEEKSSDVQRAGFDAFAYLDFSNQTRVINWFEHWRIPVPLKVREYWEASVVAAQSLPEGYIP